MHRNPQNTRNTDRSLGSGTKMLLPSLSLGFSTRGERDTISFNADCSSIVSSQLTDPTNALARTPQSTNWTSHAQVRKINSLRLSPNRNSLLLFKITKNPSPSLPGMTSFTSQALFPIWGFYCDICDCHILRTRVNTCVNVCTYPCSKPKVLSLLKPKDKIYKTKNDNIKKNPPAII